jgi:hypothetical protein
MTAASEPEIFRTDRSRRAREAAGGLSAVR